LLAQIFQIFLVLSGKKLHEIVIIAILVVLPQVTLVTYNGIADAVVSINNGLFKPKASLGTFCLI
jgi:hypothetical protein